MTRTATAQALSNIAFIKYWGNSDHHLRTPVNGSLSMNLAGLTTTTTVTFDNSLKQDQLILNGNKAKHSAVQRVTDFLDILRDQTGISDLATVESVNSFPTGTGIASSASAFAALAGAASAALDLEMDEKSLSRLARRGSGSASRSIPSGFVEWYAGRDDESSFAETIAPPEHWAIADLVVIVSDQHKAVGSTGGHQIADTSPLQKARIADTERRLNACRDAIMARDFEKFAAVVEQDTLIMHGVMMTSTPPLIYWKPTTLQIMETVTTMRQRGLAACYTMDAGPNVHVLIEGQDVNAVRKELSELPGVIDILEARPGGPMQVLSGPK